jgi:glutamate-1-semialdehyde 2,1-aminomutase
MDFTQADFDRLEAAVVDAVTAMQGDGWWLTESEYPARESRMKRRLIREMLGSLIYVPRPLYAFYTEVMRRKDDDHDASHRDHVNQLLHLLSSSVFVYCYVRIFSDLTTAMCLGLASLFVRQFGHAVLEPPCHDREATLLGYTTPQKTLIVLGYCLIPLLHAVRAPTWSLAATQAGLSHVAEQWFLWTVSVVLARVIYLAWRFDVRTSMIWYVKLVTDPVTDIYAYFPRWPH